MSGRFVRLTLKDYGGNRHNIHLPFVDPGLGVNIFFEKEDATG